MSKPIYFKLGSYPEIFKADKKREFSINIDFSAPFKVVEFENGLIVHTEVKRHTYFNRSQTSHSASLYLILEGDTLYKTVADTELAREMLDDYIEHEGWLLIEDK